MESFKNIKNNLFNTQVGTASIVFGIALIICAMLMSNGVSNIKRSNNVITVTGSTDKMIKSDNAKITFNINKKINNLNLTEGYESLKKDNDKLTDFLTSKGISINDITIGSPSSSQICRMNNNTQYPYADCNLGITGYNLSQTLTVNIKDVDLANKISTIAINELSTTPDINLYSTEYFYDNLKNDKVELMTLATKNALERANAVAAAGNSKLGSIVEASTGVIQVTAPNSVDVDDYGTYDTTTIDKKVTAVVRVSFEVK